MRSTTIFLYIMTMISNFTIFLIFQIFTFKLFFTNKTDFFMIPAALLLITSVFFLKLITFIVCCFKNSQNFIMQSLPLYTSCLFSMLLNKDVVYIEKPDGICSLTFLVDEFLGLFYIHQSFLLYIQYLHK